MPEKLLLVIDVQNDFCPGGSLEAKNGDFIIPVINYILTDYAWVIFTRDWHPADHLSFASQHPGKKPFDIGEVGGRPQRLWPNHCVKGTTGAMFHPQLKIPPHCLVVHKGMDKNKECYSAFYDCTGEATELTHMLQEGWAQDYKEFDVCGLTTDYCVKESVFDALKLGYKVRVLGQGVQAVNPDTDALEDMRAAGATID